MTAKRGKLGERLFIVASALAVIIPLSLLAVLVTDVAIDGMGRLSWDFLTSPPSRRAHMAGIMPAFVGSVYLIGLTAAIALPIGVGAAIYLEEYAAENWFTGVIETNIANLAGVPSVIYGLLGLGVFVRFFGMGRSLLSGACTLSLLVLPIVIMASREALRTVSPALREASLALGVTRWRTIRSVVLPHAAPGIATGAILSISRAMGETAPLIVVGALTYVTFTPTGLNSPYSALPIQIFNWVSRPQEAFAINAAAGIVVLLLVLLTFNGTAAFIRNKYQTKEH